MSSLVETPSGKGPADENFPVGSWLLPSKLRSHVGAYYAFARAIDDIADSPALSGEEKVARLDGFRRVLTGQWSGIPAFAKAEAIRRSMESTSVDPVHGLDLIVAFEQDAMKDRYVNWEDLMRYCRYSAAPVGRYLIDLHGESRRCYEPSDALCSALQVLNHLQDCQSDFRVLNRVYLPLDWMSECGAPFDDLDAEACSPALRRVLDRCLSESCRLIESAAALPGLIRNRRFAMEAQTIVKVAILLSNKLCNQDPLAGRVELSKIQYARCFAAGLRRGTSLRSADRMPRSKV